MTPFLATVKDYMFVFLQNLYVETLLPNVTVFGGEPFGRWALGHEGGDLTRRDTTEYAISLSLSHVRVRTARRSMNQELGSCQTSSLWHLDLGTPQPPELQERNIA